MFNCVAGCQRPAGATPLLRFGLPSLPGVVGVCCVWALGVVCVVGAVLALGWGVTGLWWHSVCVPQAPLVSVVCVLCVHSRAWHGYHWGW